LTGIVVRGLEGNARRKTLSFVVSLFDECGETEVERVKAYWSGEKGKRVRGGGCFAPLSRTGQERGKSGGK